MAKNGAGAGTARRSTHATEVPRKKNMRLHQSMIDAAKSVLGTKTETETVEAALQLIVFRDELMAGVRAMRGTELVNVFDVDVA